LEQKSGNVMKLFTTIQGDNFCLNKF